MKKINLLLGTTALAIALAAASSQAQQQGETEVLKVVTDLFDGMRKKDTTLMRSVFATNARLMSVATQNGAPTVSETPIATWIGSIARSTQSLDEKIFNPEVRIDGNLATVWTKYELWVNNTFRHCGFDAFQLGRTADGWKIIHIADSRRTEGCR